ncbi:MULTISPECIES: hypothetical protein [unclassified Variovorax]|uniref:hypothetical protein n=1 Tax=unclassified Variovorax TaxID=663243 RepID=UPI0008CA9C40|nr:MULTISPECIES: hypothetical protein [unclassified Variovorax]SEK16546.1 hypothetical protein SAMN05518853_12718 [Variovorax sp. OK202]SFE52237.1 hypothetical protein SAMN05444746_12718 [Variovorax sp. OK212]
MAKYVPLRFNDAEERVLLRLFAASGDTALGTHIKRIYFDASNPNTEALQRFRHELEGLRESVERWQGSSAGGVDPQLLVSLLCGIYLMVRKSVTEGVRAQADQLVDATAVENYLRGR